MKSVRLMLWALFILLLSTAVSAAIIHGTVYDLELHPVLGVVVEIDTEPQQRMVVMDGTYSFSIPSGNYTITASYTEDGMVQYSTKEMVLVKTDGDFVYDLFLFPDLSAEDEIFMETEAVIGENVFEDEFPWEYVITGLIILFCIAAFLIFYRILRMPKQMREDDSAVKEDVRQVLEIIEKQGGRTTQKEIRKEMPLSEAKISLIIAELEEKGRIEKIKKGRGNIIILK